MPGSNIRIVNTATGTLHTALSDKNHAFQHRLESVYRSSDGVPLNDILDQLIANDREVVFETIVVEARTDIVNLTKFVYNEVKDTLFVYLCGLQVSEGVDNDYIKLTSSSIKFNYALEPGYEVIIVLAGTLSGETYGDSVFNNLSKFTQLTDTISSYYGLENKFLMVNDSGTGIVAKTVRASHDLYLLEHTVLINDEYTAEFNFPESCYITGIKVSAQSNDSPDFTLSLLTTEMDYVYDSGPITGILWDIMKIPFISINKTLVVYVRNNAIQDNFKIQIYYEL